MCCPYVGELNACSMKNFSLTSKSPGETTSLARVLARELRPGSIVCLHGDLGAGKTTFVKGMAASLGIDKEAVTSPTFVLMNIYEGKRSLYHFDLYRLEDPKEIQGIGYEEFFYGEGISVIEWADKLKELYPTECLKIELRHKDAHTREIFFSAAGQKHGQMLRTFKGKAR
jgi:tRNA threonylcarbamoyladenosine biosynthesis protein TsaE